MKEINLNNFNVSEQEYLDMLSDYQDQTDCSVSYCANMLDQFYKFNKMYEYKEANIEKSTKEDSLKSNEYKHKISFKETELHSLLETLENKYNIDGHIYQINVIENTLINEYFIQINDYNFSFYYNYENAYYYLHVSYEHNSHFKDIEERLSTIRVLKQTINKILEKGF